MCTAPSITSGLAPAGPIRKAVPASVASVHGTGEISDLTKEETEFLQSALTVFRAGEWLAHWLEMLVDRVALATDPIRRHPTRLQIASSSAGRYYSTRTAKSRSLKRFRALGRICYSRPRNSHQQRQSRPRSRNNRPPTRAETAKEGRSCCLNAPVSWSLPQWS